MDAEALFQRGFQLRCEGRYADARDELQKVLTLSPGHKGAHHQLALIQGFEGDFDGSLASLDGLAKLHPGDLDIRYDLAMTQMMLGMYDEGCANLKFILARDPMHEKSLQQISYCP